jgi:aryl-alcohol dehydrogenase-like predicted oxidoreductase
MEHRKLGRSGLKVSVLGLGTMTFGESQTFMKGVTSQDEEARRVLDRSLDAGIDLVDTANVYSEGRSEELLGKWLLNKRKNVILATKCRFSVDAVSPSPMDLGLSRRHILQACEDSLRRLKTDWIDLYQVHMQDGSVHIEETLRALEDLVRSGKVRYIGCSNYTGYRLTESLWVADQRNLPRYESVQLQWSLVERGAERELLPACREFELGALIWSPLGRGLLSGKYKKDQPPLLGTRLDAWRDAYEKFNTTKNWKIVEVVQRIATKLESTPARVSLAWLLSKPQCTSVIIGARTVEQLEDNLAATELELSDKQLETLDEVSEPLWGYPYDFIGSREPW